MPRSSCAAVDQPLREQEARREVEVVAGSAHRHGHVALLGARLLDADLHRLLGGEPVAALLPPAALDRDDAGAGGAVRPLDRGAGGVRGAFRLGRSWSRKDSPGSRIAHIRGSYSMVRIAR